jgi:isopenicillin N synthase-like dioxygenase
VVVWRNPVYVFCQLINTMLSTGLTFVSSEYIRNTEMAVDVEPPLEIPLISLVKSTPEEVLQALSTVGFIHMDLDETGLTQDDVNQAFEILGQIHSVPVDDRADCLLDDIGNGYLSMKGSLDERTSKPDLKETFMWGRFNFNAGESQTSQNLPKSIVKYKEEIVAFDQKCFEASLKILDILSRAFEV